MSKHQNSSAINSRLPVQIDPIRLAVARQQLYGEIEIARFTRLSELLTSNEGVVKVQLDFDVDTGNVHSGKVHCATGTLVAELSLCCQRCLEPMKWSLNADVALAFIEHEHQIDELVEGYEPYLIESTPLMLSDIIEDEILLALPQVPMHDESVCKPAVKVNRQAEQVEVQDNVSQATAKKKNPFAVLADFKSDSKE